MRVIALLAVRRALIPLLANSPAVTALCPTSRIWPEETPVAPDWPFIRIGEPEATSFAPSETRGARVAGTVHCFAKGPGADAAVRLAAAVGDVIDLAVLDMSADVGFACKARLRVTGAPLLRDPAEQGAWQVAVQFVATVEA